ncbi:MAG: M48 family metalloprotease [Candidatus Pacebacteria bacterium]|nr:M48 family metalloprotease [Candidatus Paceibacterota bacterium]
MATLYTQQSNNVRKTWFLMTLFLVVLIGFGYIFSYVYNDIAILYFFIIFSIGMNIVSYWYSDKIALASARAQPIEKSQAPQLWDIVENLSITAGLPMPRLYVIDDPAPNAFATGRDKNHAAIAVTSGLLRTMTKTELEGVLSHELSHIGNRDILLSTVVVVLVGLIALLASMFRRMAFFGGGRRRDSRDGGEAGLIIFLIGLIFSILAPIAAVLIQLAISRKREFLADASGALLTRYPEGLASALQKIGQYDQPMIHANNATAHLFISNPFGPEHGSLSWLSKLFQTHPPIEDRISALMGGKS